MAEKVRFEVRLDADVHDALKGLAERMQVSVNQLLGGLTRWAASNAHPGRPSRQASGIVATTDEPGIVWFGEDGVSDEGEEVGNGQIAFALDFTERNAVRSGSEFEDQEQGGAE